MQGVQQQENLHPALTQPDQVALRTNPSQWAEEFIDHPNNGHLLLMEFVRDLPAAAHAAAAGKNPTLQRMPVCDRHVGGRGEGGSP